MRDSRGRFMTGNQFASIGGKARAARLSPARRKEIAIMGLKGLANKRFGGNIDVARNWLIKTGLAALDSGYAPEMRKFFSV